MQTYYKTLDFHMTTTCNHTCIFCSEDDRMRDYAKYPLTEFQIKTILVDRAKKGFNYVNFTGGEPTLFPKFLSLLRFTKKLGYKIYVGTNGTLLEDDAFAQEFLQYVDVLSLSIHWYDQESCTEQTGDSRHFDRFASICQNAARHKKSHHYYQSNIVVNSRNYEFLPRIISNIIDTGYLIDHVLLSYIAPEGSAKRDYQNLSVDYGLVMPYILQTKTLSDSYGKFFRVFGIPICILGPDLAEDSNDMYWKERHTIERYTTQDGRVTLIDIFSPDNSRERIFVEKCQSCEWKNKPCTGVFEAYLRYHSFS